MGENDKVQTGWKISAAAKSFVEEYAKTAGIPQWAAAEHLLETLAANPGMIDPPSKFPVEFVFVDDASNSYYAECKECTETFKPEMRGKTVERFQEWVTEHLKHV